MKNLSYLFITILILSVLFVINPLIFLWALVFLLCAAKFLIINYSFKSVKK